MGIARHWTVEHYKDFEFWLSTPLAIMGKACRRKWQCELRILHLSPRPGAGDIVVKTIYPRTKNDTPENVFASAFVESLRICDELID